MSNLPLSTKLSVPLTGVKVEVPLGLFINNEFVKSGKTLTTTDPSTGKPITDFYAAEAADTQKAIKAAKAAFPGWRKTENTQKGKLLYKLVELIEAHTDELVALESWDGGKPIAADAKANILEAIEVFRFYAGWADKIYGETIDLTEKKWAYTLHEPWGVCGQVIPWNFPFLMASWKIGPAVAAGNTVVLKPSEMTPLSVLKLCELIQQSGIPPGVINIVNGLGPDVGNELTHSPDVQKVAFTGSTNTGRTIMKQASSTLKAVTLECGGKSPNLVFDDADFEQAVKWSHIGIMSTQGQVCSATSRIYVQDSIYDKFLDALKKETENVNIGAQTSEKNFQGPQISEGQFERILGYIESGKKEGARVITGGDKLDRQGWFIKPTILADVTQNMKVAQEEIFGPVVIVSKFKTDEEALELANDTEYGLAASIFTQNITRAHQLAKGIESGTVYINSSNDNNYRIPFGGYKMSGLGRECGKYGLDTYTQVKAVHVNLGNKL